MFNKLREFLVILICITITIGIYKLNSMAANLLGKANAIQVQGKPIDTPTNAQDGYVPTYRSISGAFKYRKPWTQAQQTAYSTARQSEINSRYKRGDSPTFNNISANSLSIAQGASPSVAELFEGTNYGGLYKWSLTVGNLSADHTASFTDWLYLDGQKVPTRAEFSNLSSAVNAPKVTSFKGRTGLVQPVFGDYSTHYVSKAVATLNILDYIPINLHSGIKNGTNTTPLDSYISKALANGVVYFPSGWYLCSSSVLVSQNNTGIIGESSESTFFVTDTQITDGLIKVGRYNWADIVEFMTLNVPDQISTYLQSGTTVTVTKANHGMQTGQMVYLQGRVFPATDQAVSITYVDNNTFTATVTDSATISAGTSCHYHKRHGVDSAYSVNMSYNLVLKNISIVSRASNKTGTYGLKVRGTAYSTIDNVKIYAFKIGMYEQECQFSNFSNLHAHNAFEETDYFQSFVVGNNNMQYGFELAGADTPPPTGWPWSMGIGPHNVFDNLSAKYYSDHGVYVHGLNVGDTRLSNITCQTRSTGSANSYGILFKNPGNSSVTYASKIALTNIDVDCGKGAIHFDGGDTWNEISIGTVVYGPGMSGVTGLNLTTTNGLTNRVSPQLVHAPINATTGLYATTANKVPQWDTTNAGSLKDGLTVVTTVGNPGADTAIPTEQAVREAIAGSSGSPAGTGGEYQYNNTGSFGAGILKQIDSNSIAINATSVLSEVTDRAYLVLKGSGGPGAIEFQTAAADTDGATLGLFQASDGSTSHINKRSAFFAMGKQGTTSAARGGKITFGTKPNNSDVAAIGRLVINNDGTLFFGSTSNNADNLVNDQSATSAVFAGSIDVQAGGIVLPDNASITGVGGVNSQTTFGLSANNGTSTTVSRSDHVHGTPASPVSNTVYGIEWIGVTDISPSKNAVYNEMETRLKNNTGRGGGTTLIGGTVEGTDDLILQATDGTATSGSDIIFNAGSGTEIGRMLYDGKFGLGTATPGAKLDLYGTSATQMYIRDEQTSASGGGGVLLYHNNASIGLPKIGDRLGYFLFGGFDSTTGKNAAAVTSYTPLDWSTGVSWPAELRFETTESNTRAVKMTVGHDGNITTGTGQTVGRTMTTTYGGKAVLFQNISAINKGFFVQRDYGRSNYVRKSIQSTGQHSYSIGAVYGGYSSVGVATNCKAGGYCWIVSNGRAEVYMTNATNCGTEGAYVYVGPTAGQGLCETNIGLATHNAEAGHPLTSTLNGNFLDVFLHWNFTAPAGFSIYSAIRRRRELQKYWEDVLKG